MEEEQQTNEKQEPIKKKKSKWLQWFIVIVILCVIAAIAIPRINYERRKKILSSCSGKLRNLGLIITNYCIDQKGHYPQNLEVLTKQVYIEELPVCPLTGKSYIYDISGWDDVNFTLYCPNAEEHVGPEGPKSRMKPKSLYYSKGVGVKPRRKRQ